MSTPDAITTTPTPRRSRYCRWASRILLVLLLSVLVAYWLVPVLIKRSIESRLRDAGVIGPVVTINHLGLWESRASLVTGDGLLRVPSLTVTYTPGDLYRGRVRHISVDGAEWHVRVAAEGVSLGGLKPRAADEPSSPLLPIARPPFDSFAVSATLVVDAAGRQWHVPVNLTTAQLQNGMAVHVVSDSLLGALHGSVEANYGETVLAAQASFEDAAGLSKLQAHLTHDASETRIRLAIEPDEPHTWRLPWVAVSASSPKLAAEVALNPQGEVASLEATLTAAELGFADHFVREPTLTARVKPPGDGASRLSLNHAELSVVLTGKRGHQSSSPEAAQTLKEINAGGSLTFARDDRVFMLTFESDTYELGTLQFAGMTVVLPRVGFRGTARVAPLDPETPYSVVGSVDLEHASLEHEASRFRLEDVTAHVPIAFGQARREKGSLHIGRIELAGVSFDGVPGELHIDKNGVSAVLEGTLTGSTEAGQAVSPTDLPRVRGGFTVRLVDASPFVEARVELPEWKTGNPFLLAHYFPLLKGWEIGGTFSAAAQVTYSHGRAGAAAELAVSDATVTHPAAELELSGVAIKLKADSLMPLSTPGAQRLTVGRLKYGKVELNNLLVEARVESLDSIFIERAQWNMGAKGGFGAYAFRVDPRSPRIETELFVRDMQLQEWLRLFGGERVTAQGVLSGRVPITLDPLSMDRVLSLGRGFIHAAPGNGSIVVGERKLVEDVVKQSNVALPAVQGVDMNKALIDALTDFVYGSLAFELVPGDDGVTLVVNIAGRGRQSNPPINFQGITINVPGFDKLINHAWREHAGISESIDRGLERLYGPTPPKEKRP